MSKSFKSPKEIIGEYFAHLLVGAIMFSLLLLFGGALNLLVQLFSPLVGDPSFTLLMVGIEKAILYADAAILLWWVVYSTYKAFKELMNG